MPGLAAKPIIDMFIVVDDVENEDSFVPPQESAGLVLFAVFENPDTG